MFDNDSETDRNALIKTLQAEGLDAFEWDSGGGIIHVCVPLIASYSSPPIINTASAELRQKAENLLENADYEAFLYIATNSLQTPCEIGIIGDYGKENSQFSSADWQPVDSLEEAKIKIEKLWSNRNEWLKIFLTGESPS